jgi:hypothetical protein|tara:strand:+ start:898 stop:1317 length:420 start_codon:yes stop_codon:yes gene_type:complete
MNLWCKVGVSEIHGVGIIALKYIPMGTIITSVPEKYEKIKMLEYHRDSFCKNQLDYLNSIHCFDSRDEKIKIPETGFNLYWLQSFVNHSSKPNSIMYCLNGTYNDIINIIDVKPGEEITINFTDAYPAFYTKDKKWAKK